MFRQASTELSLDHDEDADVLYISLGRPRPALSRPSAAVDGLFLRYALDSRALCGATVVGFSTSSRTDIARALPFPINWDLLSVT